MKKSQGISISVIIIAAIALIVLVVLIAVFTGAFGDWYTSFKAKTGPLCEKSGGTPKLPSECSDIILGNFGDVEPEQVCCKDITPTPPSSD